MVLADVDILMLLTLVGLLTVATWSSSESVAAVVAAEFVDCLEHLHPDSFRSLSSTASSMMSDVSGLIRGMYCDEQMDRDLFQTWLLLVVVPLVR